MLNKPEFLMRIFEKDALTISMLKDLLSDQVVPALGDIGAVLGFTDEFVSHVKRASGVNDLVINLSMLDVDAFLCFAQTHFENGSDAIDNAQSLLINTFKKKVALIGLAHPVLFIVCIDNLGVQTAMFGEREAVCQASGLFMERASTVSVFNR